ncbi:hypothetical protein J7J18_06570 [bacterium]|nr:hypothetical protein [bacterium]
MGNPGVYGQRKFERLDYDEAISRSEIATTAVSPDQVSSELKTGQIVVQLGAGNKTIYLNKPSHQITINKLEVFGSIGAATTTTTGYLTVTLKSASSGGATTATVSGAVATLTATTANLVKSVSTTGLAATIAATQGLYLVAGATTLVDDNASAIIQYTID